MRRYNSGDRMPTGMRVVVIIAMVIIGPWIVLWIAASSSARLFWQELKIGTRELLFHIRSDRLP